MNLSQSSSSSTDLHLASLGGIIGAATEWLGTGHVLSAIIVGLASGAAVKVGGSLAGMMISFVKRKLNLKQDKSDQD